MPPFQQRAMLNDLRGLYRKVEAEGGYAGDDYDHGFNAGIRKALEHLSSAGFDEGLSSAADELERLMMDESSPMRRRCDDRFQQG